MGQMIYRHGGDTLVWGLKVETKVVEPEELDEHLADGWLDHPSQLFEQPAEPEPEPEPKAAKLRASKKATAANQQSAEDFV